MQQFFNTVSSLFFDQPLFYASADEKKDHHKVLVIGGGSGGIAFAAQLKKRFPSGVEKDIAIIEPNDKHYYQPLWTLVGAGIKNKEDSVGEERKYIPKGVEWIKDSVTEFLPNENAVITSTGSKIKYDWLLISTGTEINWDKIKGLKEAIGKNGVSTNYSYQYVDKTWENIKNFKGGVALFTNPDTPVKCGGAPQKIMWLAEDHFSRAGVRDKAQVIFATPGSAMFGVKKYSDALLELVKLRKVDTKFGHTLVEVRGDAKEAVFKKTDGNEAVIKYDIMHVTPPMQTPAAVRTSSLVAANGYVDVDKHTLQHNKFKNVFAIGDSANLPTSKTVAALTQQVPVAVANMGSAMQGKELKVKYDGYTSCPLVTSYGKLILAEFKYDNIPSETFGWMMRQDKPSSLMYFMKEKIFPFSYWHFYLKGNWYGPSTLFLPKHVKQTYNI